MPETLRDTTCEDIFDFETQQDAICDVGTSLIDPLISHRRIKQKDCERTWDAKYITNMYKYVVKRYCASVRHMKDRPEAMCDQSACPSVRITTTTTITTNEEKQEPTVEGD